MKYKIWIIVALAFFLRFYSLSNFPFGFTPDEASFGYDAYSILKTGKDQWGHSFPLVLESFGDFKAPLYSYIAIPFVWLFDLSKFSVRLPNALLGTAAVYVTFLLVTELLSYQVIKKKHLSQITDHRLTGLIASFLLAISPWHILMSRGAFEANLTTFFLPLGILLFLKGLKDRKFFIWSALAFGLNLFTYHSAKLITPFVVAALVWSFKEELRKNRSYILIPFAVFLLFLIISGMTFLQGAGTRASDINVFRGSLEGASYERWVSTSKVPDLFARVLHNKFQVGLKRFVGNYVQYFSPQFLFTQGPSEGTYGMIPGRGVLYWFELPFLLGVIFFLAKNGLTRYLIPILAWLLVAPVPAALSTGPGYAANRAVIMLPAWQIVLSYGAITVWDLIRKIKLKRTVKTISLSYLGILIIFFIYFIDDYFIQSPHKIAKAMLYGNVEVAVWLKENTSSEDKVIVSTHLSEPHIYIAFSQKWDPKNYQEETKKWKYKEWGLGWVDRMPEYELGKVTFKPINWVSIEEDAYVVGKPDEFPENLKPSKVIYYPNGEKAILILEPGNTQYAQKTY